MSFLLYTLFCGTLLYCEILYMQTGNKQQQQTEDFYTLRVFLPFLKRPFSRVLESSVSSHKLVLFCVYVLLSRDA